MWFILINEDDFPQLWKTFRNPRSLIIIINFVIKHPRVAYKNAGLCNQALPCDCGNSLLHKEPGEEHPSEVSFCKTKQINNSGK